MSIGSLTINDGTGNEVLNSLNKAFGAVSSWFAGSTDPYTSGDSVAYMWWIDTANGLVKQRNSTNDAWVVKGKVLYDGTIMWETNEVTMVGSESIELDDTQGNLILVTGNADITSLGIATAGIRRTLYFSQVLTIIHSDSAIVLPGNSNVLVEVGDVMEFLSFGSGLWRCIAYYSSAGLNKVNGNFSISGNLSVNGGGTIGGNLSVTGDISLNGKPLVMSSVPPGAIFEFAGTSPPDGFLLCNGSALSRTTYSSLFSVIGTTYGAGDGSTTFNIPNMSDRVPVGKGTSFPTLGTKGGEINHTLTTAEMPSHSHLIGTADIANYGMDYNANTGDTLYEYRAGYITRSSVAAGGGGSHNNMQPYIVLNFIIKY